jgi:hypothetical protein
LRTNQNLASEVARRLGQPLEDVLCGIRSETKVSPPDCRSIRAPT